MQLFRKSNRISLKTKLDLSRSTESKSNLLRRKTLCACQIPNMRSINRVRSKMLAMPVSFIWLTSTQLIYFRTSLMFNLFYVPPFSVPSSVCLFFHGFRCSTMCFIVVFALEMDVKGSVKSNQQVKYRCTYVNGKKSLGIHLTFFGKYLIFNGWKLKPLTATTFADIKLQPSFHTQKCSPDYAICNLNRLNFNYSQNVFAKT